MTLVRIRESDSNIELLLVKMKNGDEITRKKSINQDHISDEKKRMKFLHHLSHGDLVPFFIFTVLACLKKPGNHYQNFW